MPTQTSEVSGESVSVAPDDTTSAPPEPVVAWLLEKVTDPESSAEAPEARPRAPPLPAALPEKVTLARRTRVPASTAATAPAKAPAALETKETLEATTSEPSAAKITPPRLLVSAEAGADEQERMTALKISSSDVRDWTTRPGPGETTGSAAEVMPTTSMPSRIRVRGPVTLKRTPPPPSREQSKTTEPGGPSALRCTDLSSTT